MSKSFKHHPFMSICGDSSAQYDKTLAARGVRRACRHTLHMALCNEDYDVVLPHRLQCCHNEVYSWNRDGNQMWQGLTKQTVPDNYGTWPPEWYVKMMRK